jgi:two-component system response regulator GlrR
MGSKQILVVDDEPMVLSAIRLALTFYGYAVETACNAAEALAKLPVVDFDLVITDFNMPDMTGAVLAKEIKKHHPALPVILVSGYPPRVPPADVDMVLLKPYSTSDLQTAVLSLI